MKTAKNFNQGEIIKDWMEGGIRCLIMRGPASFCAYLGVPEGHPLEGFSYDDIPLDCHGGLTFAGINKSGGTRPKNWYFYGWDYAHAGDKCHYEIELPQFSEVGKIIENGKDWTDEEVEHEIRSVLYDFKIIVNLAEKIANKPKA
jgi:hypothetical protein